MRILLIEDDRVIGSAIRDQVDSEGHSVDWVQRLDAAGDALAGAHFDLILLVGAVAPVQARGCGQTERLCTGSHAREYKLAHHPSRVEQWTRTCIPRRGA